MKKGKNKIKLTKTKKILLSVLAVLIFIVFIICLSTADKPKEFEWSDIVLNQMLPKPPITKGKINDNSEEYLWLYLYKISAKDYEDYVNKCQTKGFNIETEKENRTFNSYNKNGYKLELYYSFDEETTEYEETTKSGRTVYVTPYGKKYHYSKSCAGKNAMEVDEQSAKNTYDPCQKCAG